MFLVVLSSALSMAGLLLDSTVIVVASMLMSPIANLVIECALHVRLKNFPRALNKLRSLSVATGMGILVAFLITMVVQHFEITHEIASRSSYDTKTMLLALLASFAVSYGFYYRDTVVAVGGAVAISLMPVLGAVGFFLASQDFHLAGSAFVLYCINVFSVFVISFIVPKKL